MKIKIALFFAVICEAAAQSPQVPHKMQFAGMTLSIRDDARREIQKDVDALTQSPRHYTIKAERARTYFPIIEKIFAEEGIPDDFKYLVLQESALIADAVSVSNAVGFWQFKDFTAMEMGLRVDKEIDERLNIASSTRAAARYLKKNNVYFNNWLYALQSYQMGAGGVLKTVKENHSGETRAEITSDTYWYIKKFLAHKVAYEEGVKGTPQTSVLVYETKSRKSLAELATEVSVAEADLKNYNKWTKSGNIPDDRSYVVMIPVITQESEANISPVILANNKASRAEAVNHKTHNPFAKSVSGKINGIATIQAIAGENPAKLATRAGVDLAAFLKWNDITISQSIIAGAYYLLGKKRARATEAYHKVLAGETLWSVSQQYGVQLKKLRRYNRLHSDVVAPGTMLWLSSMKPKSASNQETNTIAAQVDHTASFNWSINPEEKTPVVTQVDSPAVVVVEQPIDQTNGQDTVQRLADSVTQIEPTLTEVQVNTDTAKVIVEVKQPLKTHHTVQAGETLYGIAKIYSVGVMDLVNWNNLDLQQGIKPGQILKLSDSQQVTSVATVSKELTHEVKASDTLYSIARQYGVTIKELMEWNGKKDFSLAVGEKLKVIQAQ